MSKKLSMQRKNYQLVIGFCISYILLSRALHLGIMNKKLSEFELGRVVREMLHQFFKEEYILYFALLLPFLLFVSLTEEALIHKKTHIKKAEKRSKTTTFFLVVAVPLSFVLLWITSLQQNPNLFYIDATLLLICYLFFPDFVFSIPIIFPKIEKSLHKILLSREQNQAEDHGYDPLEKREKLLNAKIVGHKDATIYFKNSLFNGTTVYNGNPRRGNIVLGSAGSGKSDSLLNPWIWQTMAKEVPMFLYDFKFPTQTKVALYQYLQLKKKQPDYSLTFQINTFNPEYLHNVWRLSPINKNTILSGLHTDVYIHTLFSCMNKKWMKAPDFWSESTMAYGSAVVLAFKKYMEDKFTLPHIIHFLSQDYTKQIQALINLEDDQINTKIENIRKPVIEGKGADQLSGIFSTIQNFMSKMHNAHIFFATSKAESSLDLNHLQSPVFLSVGNDNFYRKVFSPLISLYASIVFTECNKQNKLPLHFMADEAATLYLPGVEDFINTGRSNGMITSLAFQSRAQGTFEYGQELARVIEGSLSNIYFGQVNDDSTQQVLAKKLGTYKKKVSNQTFQSGSNHISIGQTRQVEHFLRHDEIGSLSKGYFAGKVAEGEQVKFMGKVDISEYLPHFEVAENLILPLSPTVQMLLQDGSIKEDDIALYYKDNKEATRKINQQTLKYADKVYQDIMKETQLFVNALV